MLIRHFTNWQLYWYKASKNVEQGSGMLKTWNAKSKLLECQNDDLKAEGSSAYQTAVQQTGMGDAEWGITSFCKHWLCFVNSDVEGPLLKQYGCDPVSQTVTPLACYNFDMSKDFKCMQCFDAVGLAAGRASGQ